MDFTPEQITEMGLSEDQVGKVQEVVGGNIATLKHEWDGKANENAEKILDGVSSSLTTKFGLSEERQQGEKLADYIGRVSPMVIDSSVAKEKQAVTAKLAELDEKLKKGSNDALQTQYEELQAKYDGLQAKEAQFADWEENDYKGKWEQATQQLSQQTLDIAFGGIKPAFPDSVNEYEAKGRWNEFRANTEKTYNIEKGEGGEYVAIDKENPHKVVKLSDLVSKDEALSALTQGRVQNGLNSQQQQGDQTVEGIPFKVSKDMASVDVKTKVREYLSDKGYQKMSKQYSDEFAKIWQAWSKYKQ